MKNQKLNVFIARGEFADDFKTYRKAAKGQYESIELLTDISQDNFKRDHLFTDLATSNLIIEPEFRIVTTKSLAEMMKIANDADDLHVIFDTMNHEDEYDGCRDFTSAKDDWYEEQMKSEVKSNRYLRPKTEDELMIERIDELTESVQDIMRSFNKMYIGNHNKHMSSYLASRICFEATLWSHETNLYEQIGILETVKDDLKQSYADCDCE